MSESTTEAAPPEPAEGTPPPEAPEVTPETAAPASDPPEGEGDAKKDWREIALKRETRLKHEARREADQLKAELEVMRARVTPPEGGEPKDTKPAATQDAIRAEAARLVAEQQRQEARAALIQSGVKELGAEAWNEKTNVIAQLGATENPAFMEALAELPEAPKLVAALADDPTRLETLLAKRPAQMAAEMGRMAAELSAPRTRPISNAPPPVKPISGKGTLPEPDTAKMTAQELINHWKTKPPAHLAGGRRRAS